MKVFWENLGPARQPPWDPESAGYNQEMRRERKFSSTLSFSSFALSSWSSLSNDYNHHLSPLYQLTKILDVASQVISAKDDDSQGCQDQVISQGRTLRAIRVSGEVGGQIGKLILFPVFPQSLEATQELGRQSIFVSSL